MGKIDSRNKKNCLNCTHLEYAFGDINDSEGFICNRKDFYGKEEDGMIKNMTCEKYREKSKVCFTVKLFKGKE